MHDKEVYCNQLCNLQGISECGEFINSLVEFGTKKEWRPSKSYSARPATVTHKQKMAQQGSVKTECVWNKTDVRTSSASPHSGCGQSVQRTPDSRPESVLHWSNLWKKHAVVVSNKVIHISIHFVLIKEFTVYLPPSATLFYTGITMCHFIFHN